MNRSTRLATLAVGLVAALAGPAQAKDAWNQTADILGYKQLQASFTDGSVSYRRLEFIYLGAADLQVFGADGARSVETQGLGTDFFAWSDAPSGGSAADSAVGSSTDSTAST